MPLIPMKDSITIAKAGGLDEWGQPTVGEVLTLKCRIDEGSRLVRNQNGDEVVCNTRILFDKAAPVTYSDELTWTDSTGVERSANPTSIAVKKDIGSKPLLTEVTL